MCPQRIALTVHHRAMESIMCPTRITIIAMIMFLSAGLALAEDQAKADEPPKSPLAVNAMAKHERAIAKAREAMLHAVFEADQQLLRDLDGALATAMQNKN